MHVSCLLQMTGKEQARLIDQAIAPLFQVTDLMRSRDAGFRAEMREKQMAYGILLDSCGLLEMTEDAFVQKIEVIKCSLHKFSKVRNCSSLVPHISDIMQFLISIKTDVSHASHAILFSPVFSS